MNATLENILDNAMETDFIQMTTTNRKKECVLYVVFASVYLHFPTVIFRFFQSGQELSHIVINRMWC